MKVVFSKLAVLLPVLLKRTAKRTAKRTTKRTTVNAAIETNRYVHRRATAPDSEVPWLKSITIPPVINLNSPSPYASTEYEKKKKKLSSPN